MRYVEEIASGTAYEGRIDLGNTHPGDGVKFKGRGLIQLTGALNYAEVGVYFKHDFLNHPEDLKLPEWACKSAGWFWMKKNLNAYCDMPETWTKTFKGKSYNKFEWITLLINGGQNGLADRLKYYELAKKQFGL